MPINAAELVKTGIYQASGSLGSIAGELDEIDALARRRKRQVTLLFSFAAVAFIGGVLLLSLQPWIGVSVLALFGVLVYLGTRMTRGALVVGDRIKLVRGIMSMMANDTAPKTPASIWICFDQKGNTLSDKPWPVKKKGKERLATCEWLRLQTAMLDGTEVSQTITDFFRDRTYINPRGKSKKKRRITSVVVQKYKFWPEIYGDPAGFPDQVQELVHLPQSAALRDLRIDGKTLTAKMQVKVNTDLLQACTALSLGSYRILNLARLVARGRSAK
jgi:hypothetical protein